jgi:hypothetical protein
MQVLEVRKATTAHEIDRAEITEAETLVFEGRVLSRTGKLTMNPGEFYFRPNAVPFEELLPKSFLTRLFWKFAGRKAKHGVKGPGRAGIASEWRTIRVKPTPAKSCCQHCIAARPGQRAGVKQSCHGSDSS